MTLLYTDPLFLEHKTGAHPETPDRLRAISRKFGADGLIERCKAGKIVPLTPDEVVQIHSATMVDAVRRLAERGGGAIDSETVVSPESFRVGLGAAGAVVSAVDAVLNGDERNALCLIRPPGHHANADRSMGFCLFNNVALAARHARVHRGLDRVLIVDFDVHHGNGTQDIFYRDPSVHFLSLHRYGDGFYPGTGAAEETGEGPGLGATLNLAIEYGQSRVAICDSFRAGLEKAASECRPQLILVSAGFDAHRLDPIGNLGLETADYASLSQSILDVAKVHCAGRVVSCLEGGYNLAATAESAAVHLNTLLQA